MELRSLGDASKRLGAAFSEHYRISVPNNGLDSVLLEGTAFQYNPAELNTRLVELFLE